MAGGKQVIDTAKGLRKFTGGIAGTFKSLPLIGLLGAAAVAAPFVIGGIRKDRRFDEDADLPMPKELTDPLPQVMQYNPAAEAQMPATMMGEPPVVGQFAQRELSRRGGNISAGPDVTSPNIITPSGVSMIDGKHVQDLNKEASNPSMGLAV